jgi:diguanylate cyclase (GGDEF)-like protein
VAGEIALRETNVAEAALGLGLIPAASPAEVRALPTSPYLAAVLAHLPQGVLFLGPDRQLAYANPRAAELMGFTLEELQKTNRAEVVARLKGRAVDPEELGARMRIPPEGPYLFDAELELCRPHRQILRWSSRPVPLGAASGQLVLIEDVTRERDLLEERDRLARTDALTGLGNRRNAEEAIDREVARAQRQSSPLAFVLFDIDHFKKVNDTFGHAAGDAALRAVGDLLRQAFRGFDVASRWGGEEFLVVLPGADLKQARLAADRVRGQIEAKPVEGVGPLTVSAGCAELGKEDTVASAVGRADERLYEAKRTGRNRVA